MTLHSFLYWLARILEDLFRPLAVVELVGVR